MGENATASFSISNVGGERGLFVASLLLNVTIVQTLDISLEPGASKRITFDTNGNEPGQYTVQVAGLSGSFESVIW